MSDIDLLILCIPAYEVREYLEHGRKSGDGKDENHRHNRLAACAVSYVRQEPEPYARTPRTGKEIVNGAEEGSWPSALGPAPQEIRDVVVGKETNETERSKR